MLIPEALDSEMTVDGVSEKNEKGYLDELDRNIGVEESASKISADEPLYDGAPVNVAVSMLLIITFAIRHSLSGVALVDFLTLVSLHCALPNQYRWFTVIYSVSKTP